MSTTTNRKQPHNPRKRRWLTTPRSRLRTATFVLVIALLELLNVAFHGTLKHHQLSLEAFCWGSLGATYIALNRYLPSDRKPRKD